MCSALPLFRRNAGALSSKKGMKDMPYALDNPRRAIVLEAIRQVCAYRGWALLAIHVRSSHVHFVVSAEEAPERILNTAKAYASRMLNQREPNQDARRRWARHGSTRYLWNPEQVGAATHYVIREQGEPMAVWEKAMA
jgi:REP element-mobilizing transposase RayT